MLRESGMTFASVCLAILATSALFLWVRRYSYRNSVYKMHPFNQCIVAVSEEGRRNGLYLKMEEVKHICKDLADMPYVIDDYGNSKTRIRTKNVEG